MQLFALDEQEKIPAYAAEKGKNYTCFECGKVLRVRGGSYRRDHFYHLRENPSCRQSNKSQRHLQIQFALQKILPPNDTKLEVIFLKILRIADVLWLSKKIVFEVQCSSISENEVRNRMEDYRSLGYQVVWILDDRKFNRKKVSPSEAYLRRTLSYFSACSGKEIHFYDQFERIHRGNRIHKLGHFNVHLDKPYLTPEIRPQWKRRLPKNILFRLENNRLYFMRDCVSYSLHCLKNDLPNKYLEFPRKRSFFRKPIDAYLEILEAFLHH